MISLPNPDPNQKNDTDHAEMSRDELNVISMKLGSHKDKFNSSPIYNARIMESENSLGRNKILEISLIGIGVGFAPMEGVGAQMNNGAMIAAHRASNVYTRRQLAADSSSKPVRIGPNTAPAAKPA